MTINATDIKLLESEVMADTTDGGGRRTSRVIPDGVAGNIFPKVSRLDSTYGRVNLRKVYGAVQTANVDTYAGSHVIITDAPDNAKIHTTLFSTASEFDNRTAARDRIESYVTSGPESRMILLGRQLPGQQTVLAYQRIEDALPEIGEVYCISSESGATVTAYQYFRVQSVESEIRTFTESVGNSFVDFKRRVVTIGTGIPLRYEFNGPETPTMASGVTRPSKLRTTTVVDAARYFGIQKLAETAQAGDLAIKVQSVYSPIVPTTNRETPIANANIAGAPNIVAAKASSVTETVSSLWANGSTFRTRRPIVPGSLSISAPGYFSGAVDDKKGTVTTAGITATVDYENGVITRTGGAATTPSSYSLTYTPGAADNQIAHTLETEITIANRGTVYAFTVNPLPSPGSMFFDFRALGKWYRLRDNGAGELRGDDSAYGVGTLDYATGSLVMTLGALPDVGSALLIGWGSGIHYKVRADATADAGGSIKQKITLPDVPVASDSVSLTYTSGGVQYTATDNSVGALSGNGITGKVDYTNGVVEIEYTTRLPDPNTNVSVSYNQVVPVDPEDVVHRVASLAASTSFSLGTGIVPGSFVGTIPMAGSGCGGTVTVTDNGSGLLAVAGGQVLRSGSDDVKDAYIANAQNIGTINYTTGEIAINNTVTVSYNYYKPTLVTVVAGLPQVQTGASWESTQGAISVTSGTASYAWKDSGVSASTSAKTYDATFTAAPIYFDLTRTVAERYVPGSIMLSADGKTYIDRNGSLYMDVNNVTGAGTLAGTIDYATGKATLSSWASGAAISLSVLAGATTYGEHSEYQVSFRTAGSPIRPGSMYVQATTDTGVLLSGTSNDSGAISGTKVAGTVEQEMGVASIKFGQMVTAAGNESQWWYDPDLVVGGMIFKPEPVIPSTLRYNAVVISNLPLNADILGLDPVRLPSDGRVPIYRDADVVVIHNTQATALTNPVAPGSTYSVGRTNLADLWLVDQNGVKLSSSQYAFNLVAGTVTIAADFSAGALVQPLIAKHRIEDMALVTDVQINGEITLADALARDYDANSYCSSAILFGDMNGRVTNVFDLLSFSVWSDTLGTQATAQYNNIDYPIEILNNGAVTERWRINFTSTTAFQVIGENLGVIATGTTGTDCAPTNALTGLPYFVIRAAGWGSGWSAGNQLRFNTISASAPIWIARTVLPGATLEGDSFSLQVRGDVDAE